MFLLSTPARPYARRGSALLSCVFMVFISCLRFVLGVEILTEHASGWSQRHRALLSQGFVQQIEREAQHAGLSVAQSRLQFLKPLGLIILQSHSDRFHHFSVLL